MKIQVEWNPARASAYRLVGYESRLLAPEDFRDDEKDAGEIGAGHSVTALYEVIPAGVEAPVRAVDPLKYQATRGPASRSDALLTVKVRYKKPEGRESIPLELSLVDRGATFAAGDAHRREFLGLARKAKALAEPSGS